MANAPFPLFCSTPPPIDDEADASPVNAEPDDDFGDFADAYQETLSNYMEDTGDSDFNDFSGIPQFLEHTSNEPNKAPIAEVDFTEPNIPKTDYNCDYINVNDIELLKGRGNPNKSTQEDDFQSALTNEHTTSLSSLSEQQTSSATSISPISKSPTPRHETELDVGDDKDFGEFQFDKSIEVNKSDSGRSTENDSVSHEAVDKPKELPPLSNIVVLEDLIDDSSDDERLSPRNRNITYCDESSSDFFAIHSVEENENIDEVVHDSVSEVDNHTTLSMDATQTEAQLSVPESSTSTEKHVLASEASTSPELTADDERIAIIQQQTEADKKASNADITCDNKPEGSHNVVESSLNEASSTNDIEDDFANFQDFSSASDKQSVWPISTDNTKPETSEKTLNDLTQSSETNSAVATEGFVDDEDDDDDFGDFSEAPIVATSHVPISTPQPTISVVKQHLGEQLKPILEIMFPSALAACETSNFDLNTSQKTKTNTTNSAPMELAFVESAKALEYQWSGSFVRHAFIKSLGIDSRNIFLTEKWNSAMPRFAANLSFDPLQPLKPTSVPLQPETVSSTANGSKPDVPVAEFDWKSSGLVNPLDGPQTEMASQSIDASKTESSFPSDIENDGNACPSSTDATTETSTVAASTAGGTLPSTLAGGGDIDGSDNNFSNDIDIGLYDMLSSKSSTQLPKEALCTETQSLDFDESLKQSKDIKVLDTIGCATVESSISLDVYKLDGDAEVRIDNGVISRSTFAGPLKETHIFTPSKNVPDLYDNKNMTTIGRAASPATTGCAPKVLPIDFDYEKAAAGIIIDETVVHKEYRDLEYNPGFGLEIPIPTSSATQAVAKPLSTSNNALSMQQQHEEIDDEFTDFQSVPAPAPAPTSAPASEPLRTMTTRNDKLSTPTPMNGMILSPAILLPQAISMVSKQPKIEWGDSAANIDPDELARIEQLFPQDNSSRNSSKKSTPTHVAMQQTSLSISATIANKTTPEHIVDDDDWSDFISVPVSATNRTASRSPQKSRVETNDDEWSDFVSSAPNTHATIANLRVTPTPTATAAYGGGMPQFNSASWQNANFYNNPLSVYHRNQINAVPNMTPTKLQNNNYSNHNNNNNNNSNHSNNHHNNRSNSNNNFTPYLSHYPARQEKLPQQQQQHRQQQQQQQIQVMQDFSTASSDFTPYRPNIPPQSNYTGPTNNTHFQVGSAKVAPTVSLIPDLGFVAPAMPVHTAIINALPKPSSNSKK